MRIYFFFQRRHLEAEQAHGNMLNIMYIKYTCTCESQNVSHSVMLNSANLCSVACQVPLSMEFSRQEYWKESEVKSLSHTRLFATRWTVACTKLLHPWDFLSKSTGVGCRFLLQGIFPGIEPRSPSL